MRDLIVLMRLAIIFNRKAPYLSSMRVPDVPCACKRPCIRINVQNLRIKTLLFKEVKRKNPNYCNTHAFSLQEQTKSLFWNAHNQNQFRCLLLFCTREGSPQAEQKRRKANPTESWRHLNDSFILLCRSLVSEHDFFRRRKIIEFKGCRFSNCFAMSEMPTNGVNPSF